MNLERWVDARVESVGVSALRHYLEAHGWTLKPFSRPQVLLYEGPHDDAGEPITQWVSASEQFSDYREGIVQLITNLSVIEDRHPVEVLNDILGRNGTESAARGNAASTQETAAVRPG
jgi:hypothetical protein